MSSTATLDQDALANLTPEEREAFDEPKEDAAALAKIAGSDAADDEGDSDEVLDADGKPVVVTPAADKAPEVKPDTPAAPVAAADQPPTGYKAALPEDFENKVKDLQTRSTELRAKFKAGDIEFDEYDAENATLLQEREALTVARAKAEISSEMTQQSAEQAWNSAISKLFDAAKTEGVDYRTDTARNADLDGFVKALANNPANADRSMDWFLTEAHKRVNALHGAATPAPAPTPGVKPAPTDTSRKPPPAPKNIAAIPGGDGPGDVGSEFAHLDALEGNELEAAIAKMTPAQREKFSRGG
jgi:hypothetical protein